MTIPQLTFDPDDYIFPTGVLHQDIDMAFDNTVVLATLVHNGSTRTTNAEDKPVWVMIVGDWVGDDFVEISDISEMTAGEQIALADFTTNLVAYATAARDTRLQNEQDYTDEELAAWQGINFARDPDNQPLFTNLTEANQRFMQLAEAVHVLFKRMREDLDA